jgi:hypothetical protein
MLYRPRVDGRRRSISPGPTWRPPSDGARSRGGGFSREREEIAAYSFGE